MSIDIDQVRINGNKSEDKTVPTLDTPKIINPDSQINYQSTNFDGSSAYQPMLGNIATNQKVIESFFGVDSELIKKERVAAQQAPMCILENSLEDQLKILWREFPLKGKFERDTTQYNLLNRIEDLTPGSAFAINLDNYLDGKKNLLSEYSLGVILKDCAKKGVIPVFVFNDYSFAEKPSDILKIAISYAESGGESAFLVRFKEVDLKEQQVGFIFRCTKNPTDIDAIKSHMSVVARGRYSSPPLSGQESLKLAASMADTISDKSHRFLKPFSDISKITHKSYEGLYKKLPTDHILTLAAKVNKEITQGNPPKINAAIGTIASMGGKLVLPEAFIEASRSEEFLNRDRSIVRLGGSPEFLYSAHKLFLGEEYFSKHRGSLVAVQGYGGTSEVVLSINLAKKLCEEIFKESDPVIAYPNTPWPNVVSVVNATGLKHKVYNIFDSKHYKNIPLSSEVDNLSANIIYADLSCQNYSGRAWSSEDINTIVETAIQNRSILVLDNAYQGLGDGFYEDTKLLRAALDNLSELPGVFVANSLAKNAFAFGYRGAFLSFYSQDTELLGFVKTNMIDLSEKLYGNVPEDFTSLATIVFKNKHYTDMWLKEELEPRRELLVKQREALSDVFIKNGYPAKLIDPVMRNGRGLFTTFPFLTKEQAVQLHEELRVIVLQDGSARINIAGIPLEKMEIFSDAVGKIASSPE